MKEEWLEVIEWIQLSVTLVYLLMMIGVMALVIKYNNLEFNGLWKTRATLVWLSILWGISLLLGRHHLWGSFGALSDNQHHFRALCRAHVFLTFGFSQPLFFLIILMILRSKERSKLMLYELDPNQFIVMRAVLWCIPVILVHIVILGLSGVAGSGSGAVVWTTYEEDHHHCVVPVLSTASFAIFYCFFLLFYLLTSARLFTRMINRTLRFRIRCTQLFFIVAFPLEIFLRFISIFISDYHDAYEAVYHTYFFLELVVSAVAIIELVLMPILDAISFPLLAGVTANACQEYHKTEEERKQRRYTRTVPALQRVLSEDGVDKSHSSSSSSSSNTNNNINKTKNNSNNTKIELEPLYKKQPQPQPQQPLNDSTSSMSPSSSETVTSRKPLLSPSLPLSSAPVPSPSNDSLSEGGQQEDSPRTINTISNLSQLTNNLNATLTAAGGYPADLDVDDIFADIDDMDDSLPADNNSLKLKVDGVFLQDP